MIFINLKYFLTPMSIVIPGARSATWNPGGREINKSLTNKDSTYILLLDPGYFVLSLKLQEKIPG